METPENKATLADRLVNGLKHAAIEIEELRLQAALGKLEARDAWEDIKKEFNARIHEARQDFIKFKSSEDTLKIINAFEFLQVQLTLGIAETRDTFEEQEKKIRHALAEVESSIRNNSKLELYSGQVRTEVAKFKVKLELLSLHYKLKKIAVQFDFQDKKKQLFEKLESIKQRITTDSREKWEHFREEIGEAYTHFKNTFEEKDK